MSQWLVEALTRAGAYDRKYLVRAVNLFENMLGFSNHHSMFSEEISQTGEQLGNTPQAFSHLALISAAFNLDRAMNGDARMKIHSELRQPSRHFGDVILQLGSSGSYLS
ncbi:hypothetical protein F5Y12DRAFT_603845 [Xylaria sp. FL1777]|nr:hypothetical protein F5Y12DRAFT_603845 [Xylaria sp. FL1777]